MELQSFFRYAVLACSITTLAACSSSGSDAPATTTISGSIFATVGALLWLLVRADEPMSEEVS